ncbi:hypothetical protein HBI60_163530 [Parastagonospora nodorum]|nr:hypothetical protein HBH46_153810 [Parastagonospora nodorum]KAH6391878.1 hypothetical protein HBI60_163530 [Parastagonospora nodorum]KAH6477074.1 hypothetical protein HBI58_104010 [Parastagonospora nodorum]
MSCFSQVGSKQNPLLGTVSFPMPTKTIICNSVSRKYSLESRLQIVTPIQSLLLLHPPQTKAHPPNLLAPTLLPLLHTHPHPTLQLLSRDVLPLPARQPNQIARNLDLKNLCDRTTIFMQTPQLCGNNEAVPHKLVELFIPLPGVDRRLAKSLHTLTFIGIRRVDFEKVFHLLEVLMISCSADVVDEGGEVVGEVLAALFPRRVFGWERQIEQ